MTSRKQRRNNKQEKKKDIKESSFSKKFIRMCVVISIIGIAIYYGLYKLNTILGNDVIAYTEAGSKNSNLIESIQKKDEVSLLFAGTDESGLRTDSIMYMKYDTVNNKLYMISIPRDTYTYNIYANKKINNIYTGGKHVDALVEEVENMLDVNIDYYCVMNLNLITEIVKKINGLDIKIEKDVWKKNKKTGQWYLFLKAGQQTLNAKQVEKLVRNRDYREGDIEREKVQRQVMIELIKNVLQSENILKLPSIVNTVVTNTNTNITAREALAYASEIKELDLDNVTSTVAPWEYYELNGVSYVKVDNNKAASIVERWKEISNSSNESE